LIAAAVPLVRHLVVELEEGVLDSIIRVDQFTDSLEVAVTQVQQVVRDTLLVGVVCLLPQALPELGHLVPIIVNLEVLWDHNKF